MGRTSIGRHSTGRHVGHNNCREIWATKDGARIGLDRGTPTFANVLKQAGYKTGFFINGTPCTRPAECTVMTARSCPISAGTIGWCTPSTIAARRIGHGGIRVPMVVACPGTIPADSVSHDPWYFADAMATFTDIADAESLLPGDTDGQSIWPVLRGEREHLNVRPLYWESYNGHGGFRQAVRTGPWKLMRFSSLERVHPSNPELPEKSPLAYLELYNLDDDPGERINVADLHPVICRELTGVMNDAYTPPPRRFSAERNRATRVRHSDVGGPRAGDSWLSQHKV